MEKEDIEKEDIEKKDIEKTVETIVNMGDLVDNFSYDFIKQLTELNVFIKALLDKHYEQEKIIAETRAKQSELERKYYESEKENNKLINKLMDTNEKLREGAKENITQAAAIEELQQEMKELKDSIILSKDDRYKDGRPPLKDEEIIKIRELLAEGLTMRKVAELVEKSISTVQKYSKLQPEPATKPKNESSGNLTGSSVF